MFRRLVKDESGIAMGLAVVVVVLVGVMGAGLLVFVRNDLEAVVEVNQGQVAFETADAGLKAGRSHLLGESNPVKYDGINNPAGTPPNPESAWSFSGPGKNYIFNGNNITVTIQHLPAVVEPATPTVDEAPEVIPSGQTSLPNGRNYYRVVSEGRAGDARRRVEAIYNTYDLDVPKAYFTPGSITVNGTACITDVSLFARGSITLNGTNGSCAGGSHITGEDRAYGNWQNALNPTARPNTLAGMGATGSINRKVAGRDYDSSTTPTFVEAIDPAAASGSQIRFPFNPNSSIDIRELERIAQEQDLETPGTTNYFSIGDSTANVSSWPDNSTNETVVYYRFTDGTPGNNQLKWTVPGSCSDNPPKQGTLVVEGAGFTTQPNRARFKGVVIVREGEFVPSNADDGTSSDSGNTCLEGFVNASGNITIAGSVTPSSSADLANRPGFYGVRQWSWRELYQ